ncbi:MAG: beta-galactosidase [Streptomyces oryziradicis]|nr:beta-galactosidase [Actinacidiphila oryziradicis]
MRGPGTRRGARRLVTPGAQTYARPVRPRKACRAAALLAPVLLAALGPAQAYSAAAHQAHTITYDDHSLSIDGRRLYIWSGDFHYWRLPSPDAWRDVLQKMKSGGFNTASIYFDWDFHSPAPGVYDFTGIRDVDRLLDIADEVGIYVIARPGPYINAETDGGGFPGWLAVQKGHARSTDPDYLAAADEWLSHIDPVIARHQLTDGKGSVIAYQVENEYYRDTPDGHAYIQHLRDKARADGISVPLTGNHKGIFTKELDIDGYDRYPQEFNCSHPDVWNKLPDMAFSHNPGEPLFLPEFQGGAFDPWGGPGYDKCRQLTDGDFEKAAYENNIASGATMQNFYMAYGGTSWGYLATPGSVYTSYDYGAPIREDRTLTEKYLVDKRLGYFVQSVAPLTKTDEVTDVPAPSSTAVLQRTRRNPDTGTTFAVVRHQDVNGKATDTALITLGGHLDIPVTIAGRDSKLLVADYTMDHQRLQYSTSEIMTHGTFGDRDIALLYGRPGQPGRTVLRYGAQPRVTVLSGAVRHTWNAGDLMLDYTHLGLARVLVQPTGGGTPLLLLLADDATADTFWRVGPSLVRGPELVRTAAYGNGVLKLTGDTDRPTRLAVFDGARAAAVTWNGRAVIGGELPGPGPVTMPELSGWKYAQEPATEDDRTWCTAAGPSLNADLYGYHAGAVRYQGHFTATGGETGAALTVSTGKAGTHLAWLNGHYLGTGRDLGFPAEALKPGQDNVLSVLTVNMGHEQDFHDNDSHKQPRGLVSASLLGSAQPITWRIRGGLPDPVRGPLNNGGLYGEHHGFHLPARPDAGWSITAPATAPGVLWARTAFSLALPPGQDVPVSLTVSGLSRAQLYLNGYLIGHYIPALGPQTAFPVPPGLLHTHGRNTLAIAAINGPAPTVTLTPTGNFTTPLSYADVP